MNELEKKNKHLNDLLDSALEDYDKMLKALLDIKEYIEKYGTGKGMGEEWFETSTPVTYLKNIVNKALGSDK